MPVCSRVAFVSANTVRPQRVCLELLETYLFSGFEPRNRGTDLVSEIPCMRCVLFVEFICHSFDLVNIPRHAEPGVCLRGDSIVFPIQPEVCVILSFNEPVSSLVSISAPGLHRQRLIFIIVVPSLFVGVFDYTGNSVGGG